MKIVEGGIPEEKAWRSLVLLAPGEQVGISWQLGLTLAQANNGELVAAIIIANPTGDLLSLASETLSRARKASRPEDPVYTAIIHDKDYRRAASQLSHAADIDLLITTSETPGWQSLNRMPCAVAVVRGELYNPLRTGPIAEDSPTGQRPVQRILVPTSGGPNSAHALGLLLPLTNREVKVKAFYVAPEYLGANEEALGRARLRQTLNFIDAGDRIDPVLKTAASVTEGIIQEASNDYDLVIIGASLESSLDRTLFGNIPETVVSQLKKPVLVVRQPSGRFDSLFSQLSWRIQMFIPRLNLRERTQAYVRIRRGARPNTDFYVLIALSAIIASFGLLANSTAVVIGAMLVAPLMSPIAGAGLAMVLGDTRFLRLTLGAIVRGTLVALAMGIIVGLVPLQNPLTDEILARTHPSLLDVGVAIFSGMAVAYALCRSEAGAALPGVAIAAALVPPLASSGICLANGFFPEFGGALLLFLTNFVAISTAAALVFLILGFRPSSAQKDRRAVRSRSARVALVGLITISGIVAYTTYRLGQESTTRAHINDIASQGVTEITEAELGTLEIGDLGAEVLTLDLIVRSPHAIPHAQVVELQEYIATEIQREVAITMTVIRTTKLDPFNPPTLTPSATFTQTPTTGPTFTHTPLATLTQTPGPTNTPEPTATSSPAPSATASPAPTNTATFSPTPELPTAVVGSTYGLNLRADPSTTADVLRFLEAGTEVILLSGQETGPEGLWQQIRVDDLTGWVMAEFILEPVPVAP